MPEILHACPKCNRSGFTAKGLTAHKCKAPKVESVEVEVLIDSQPSALTSPIARQIATINEHWRAAEHHHQQSCAHLIMAGHQLLDLKKKAKHGDWGTYFSSAAKRLKGGEGKCQPELAFGFSEEWARRLMEMAKASKQHLPELAALPFDQPLSDWKEDSLQTLRSAVSKKADGETLQQLAFEWGVSKKPAQPIADKRGGPGGARTPGETLTPEKLQEKERELAHKEALEIAALVDAFMKSKKPTLIDKDHHTTLHGAISSAAATLKKIKL